MVKKMLIEATHPEETRVVVVDGTRLEEFDVETSTKKQLKGNIYLAKVIRVEPSLQAAFVDYGNERHGFLPFSEIHPDYYQIPIADREALKETLAASQRACAADEDDEVEEELESAAKHDEELESEAEEEERGKSRRRRPRHHRRYEELSDTADIETFSEGSSESARRLRRAYLDLIRNYKIQEVVHRNQILLVQVVKEERGNKGAALTTYLSLAGRYCVLMPNNARGGGVSRKIASMAERHKLKTIVNALPVPDGMSVIVRTAGRDKTKIDIRKDYEYLISTWVSIRDMTMASVAPCLIHEEGNLIRRAVRDLYTPDTTEIIIEGEEAFTQASAFMKMIAPQLSRRIINYTDNIPLFHRYQIETQLEAMHNPVVQLRSGGYLVINPTEALVAIDVNSGRSTKEHSVEDTALKTNLEAVEEVARQLKLRDLAGLIVIDLIDMEEPRNNSAVEKRMREVLRYDRARIQMAHINGFGLMELSRQRLHSSFIETSYHQCPYCQGTGIQRSIESISVHLLRLLEEEGGRGRSSVITLTVPSNVALYLLNHKRQLILELEKIYDVRIVINGDDSFISPVDYRIERQKKTFTPRGDRGDRGEKGGKSDFASASEDDSQAATDFASDSASPDSELSEANEATEEAEGEDASQRRPRGRRGLFGRRGRGDRGDRNDRGNRRRDNRDRGDNHPYNDSADSLEGVPSSFDEAPAGDSTTSASDSADSEGSYRDKDSSRRPYGRDRDRNRGRGRNRNDRNDRDSDRGDRNDDSANSASFAATPAAKQDTEPKGAVVLFSSYRKKKQDKTEEKAEPADGALAPTSTPAEVASEPAATATEAPASPAPKRGRGRPAKAKKPEAVPEAKVAEPQEQPQEQALPIKDKPKRGGWWSKKSDKT